MEEFNSFYIAITRLPGDQPIVHVKKLAWTIKGDHYDIPIDLQNIDNHEVLSKDNKYITTFNLIKNSNKGATRRIKYYTFNSNNDLTDIAKEYLVQLDNELIFKFKGYTLNKETDNTEPKNKNLLHNYTILELLEFNENNCDDGLIDYNNESSNYNVHDFTKASNGKFIFLLNLLNLYNNLFIY